MSNAPDLDDYFVLPDGLPKITPADDTRLTNAVDFTIERDGHTIGNILRMQLLRDPTVIFAGYKVPHPLESHVIVKVQTNNDSTPVEAMVRAIKCLVKELDGIATSFKSQVESTHDPHQGYQ
uniref:DNA-directed RNA polymerase RBP11-like dimerisation domain-containing protein n=1 Tax=Vannella robusta TaxID=1487602 RepID=A0A7S4I7A9_9EUKA|mmetsp:Transcript_21543/g.27412  ORF Transcript_21543/g.27412 Transcript_21543/m.27412 type:complete len:122 (+) Transcript_21543:181-546(+)